MQQNSSNFLDTQKYSTQVAFVCRLIQSKWGQGRGKSVDFAMDQRKHSKGIMAPALFSVRFLKFAQTRFLPCESLANRIVANPQHRRTNWMNCFQSSYCRQQILIYQNLSCLDDMRSNLMCYNFEIIY